VSEVGHNVRTGYFSQNRIDVLNASRTVLDSARDMPNPVSEQTARTVLGSFLFRGDDVFKTVSVLSGGEKSRLALVRLLLDPPNLLLMDEPTTHLDVGSIDALIGALKQYHGTLIFISHDVHFIRAIATSVLHITAGANRTGGKLTFYAGDYDYYLDKSKATSARIALTAGRDAPEVNGLAVASKLQLGIRKQNGSGLRKQKEQKRLEAEARNAIAKARREKEKRVHELETKIAALEGQQKELAAALEDPAAYTPGGRAIAINRDLSALSHDLARLTAEWESVTATVSTS
jgi:ATP-binding cassette subfamily F protein 3